MEPPRLGGGQMGDGLRQSFQQQFFSGLVNLPNNQIFRGLHQEHGVVFNAGAAIH